MLDQLPPHRFSPLIRYRVGDGIVGPEVLPHGHVNRFLGVAGRLTDVVDLGGGEAVHNLAILHCVHNEPGAYNIQMRLHDRGIECRLVVAPDADRPSLEARIRRRFGLLHPALGQAQFTFSEDVATSRAGKRRWCIDERTAVPPCAE